LPWLGPIVVAAFATVFVAVTRPHAGAAQLLLVAGLLGLVVDGGLVAGGVLAFTKPAGGPAFVAPWMIALWVAFATTLPWSMSFLSERILLAAILGAILGPLAYVAGARLGAVTIGASLSRSLGAIAVGWGIALPALVLASNWLLRRRVRLERP
jgi:uncharacterized protein (TIGR03382 family)